MGLPIYRENVLNSCMHSCAMYNDTGDWLFYRVSVCVVADIVQQFDNYIIICMLLLVSFQ